MKVLEELIEEIKRSQVMLSDSGLGMSVELVVRPTPGDLAYVLVGRWCGHEHQLLVSSAKDHQPNAIALVRRAVAQWAKLARDSDRNRRREIPS